MFTLVVIIHVIVCLIIIAMVLLQAGKGADIGSAFGGAGSQAVFGSMGTPSLLGKVTTGVALAFALTSFWLAIQGHRVPAPILPAAPPASTTPGPAPAPAPK